MPSDTWLAHGNSSPGLDLALIPLYKLGSCCGASQVSTHTAASADLESAQAQSLGVPGVPACLGLSLTWKDLAALSEANSTAHLPHTHLGSYI